MAGPLQFGDGKIVVDQVVLNTPDIFHDVRPSKQLVQAGVAEPLGKAPEGIHCLAVPKEKTHPFPKIGFAQIVAVVPFGSGIELLSVEPKWVPGTGLLKDTRSQSS